MKYLVIISVIFLISLTSAQTNDISNELALNQVYEIIKRPEMLPAKCSIRKNGIGVMGNSSGNIYALNFRIKRRKILFSDSVGISLRGPLKFIAEPGIEANKLGRLYRYDQLSRTLGCNYGDGIKLCKYKRQFLELRLNSSNKISELKAFEVKMKNKTVIKKLGFVHCI